jgi:membrane-associated protease RseP (regulator of RpoE activity)
MMLASADSGTARNLGIPAMVAGVVVAEVSNDPRSRVAQVGLMPGDVIVKVDGTSTQNLAELYTLTTRLSVARPLPIEVMRQGQTMMVVLPPPMEAATQPPMTLAQPGAAPATPQAQTQAAWNSGRALPQSMPAQAATPAAPPQQNAATWPVMPAPAAPNTVMGP